jgi:lipopolysaccharide/colanic/teichoic acid biosynthesis glycosyltransferase
MRAVIFSTGDWPGIKPLNDRYPAPLLPLVDRPFLQHVVEHLAGQGITKLEFVLSHLPEKIEHLLGDGHRWGCKFTYHLVRDAERPYRVLRTMHFEENEPILLGHGERLPLLTVKGAATSAVPILFCTRHDNSDNGVERLDWTGWALVTPEHVAQLPPEVDLAGLLDHLEQVKSEGPERRVVARSLATLTFNDMLAGHEAVLGKHFEGLLLTGREIEPGIWLSRNVMLHPTAEIFPPVYVGENCRIEAGVKLGPRAVLGHDCVLDTHSTVTNSLVFPGSYVGEGLELAEVIVDKNLLINVRVGGVLTISDITILGSMSDTPLHRLLGRMFSRTAALVALLLTAPIVILTACLLRTIRRGQPVLYRRNVVRLPAGAEEMTWETFPLLSFVPPQEIHDQAARAVPATKRDFVLRVLPGLLNVLRGQLALVGVPPRNRDEIQALPDDWRRLYLSGKAGLVTESAVHCDPDATNDDLYAAETFYVASAGWRHDLRVFLGYLGRAFCGFLYPSRRTADAGTEVEDESAVSA